MQITKSRLKTGMRAPTVTAGSLKNSRRVARTLMCMALW
ncbi:Uncharacterised protein [Klebsiella pneumoniae]|uniref:Uncharacterized protein n=1 Tax=Klebsiella pneumoniae TaxID=573 RepID=A0A2X3D9A4_KLEPN|nr:Uncharacterised protein [Klebsiella pneumoniae]